MKKNLFEEYLKDVHAKQYIGGDDDMPDAFDKWLCEMDMDDLMKLGGEAIEKALEDASESMELREE